MGGIFGTISKKSCVADLFYGTDYNSHLGTRRGGMAAFEREKGFVRSIHNLENAYFRSKFEPSLGKFDGCTAGIGAISVAQTFRKEYALCRDVVGQDQPYRAGGLAADTGQDLS